MNKAIKSNFESSLPISQAKSAQELMIKVRNSIKAIVIITSVEEAEYIKSLYLGLDMVQNIHSIIFYSADI